MSCLIRSNQLVEYNVSKGLITSLEVHGPPDLQGHGSDGLLTAILRLGRSGCPGTPATARDQRSLPVAQQSWGRNMLGGAATVPPSILQVSSPPLFSWPVNPPGKPWRRGNKGGPLQAPLLPQGQGVHAGGHMFCPHVCMHTSTLTAGLQQSTSCRYWFWHSHCCAYFIGTAVGMPKNCPPDSRKLLICGGGRGEGRVQPWVWRCKSEAVPHPQTRN